MDVSNEVAFHNSLVMTVSYEAVGRLASRQRKAP